MYIRTIFQNAQVVWLEESGCHLDESLFVSADLSTHLKRQMGMMLFCARCKNNEDADEKKNVTCQNVRSHTGIEISKKHLKDEFLPQENCTKAFNIWRFSDPQSSVQPVASCKAARELEALVFKAFERKRNADLTLIKRKSENPIRKKKRRTCWDVG